MPKGDSEWSLTLRSAFSMFPTGVIAVCAQLEDEPVGIAVNSFTSVSLDPPLVAISVANASTTWPRLATVESLGLSVLASTHQDFCKRLATKGATNKFEDVSWQRSGSGAVLIDNSVLWLECAVHQIMKAGDHQVVLLNVRNVDVFPDSEPLIFHRSQMLSLPSRG